MNSVLRLVGAAAVVCAVNCVPLWGQNAAGPATGAAKAIGGGAAVPAAQADVPVKMVVLYSSGVGYFEHFGTVNGNTSTEIGFKSEQINDLLVSQHRVSGGRACAEKHAHHQTPNDDCAGHVPQPVTPRNLVRLFRHVYEFALSEISRPPAQQTSPVPPCARDVVPRWP